jgi:hypothetical protein
MAPASRCSRKDSGAFGNEPLNWTAAPATAAAPTLTGAPPVITVQPQNQLLAASQNGSFSVIATGAPPLRYQWCFNGALLIGATNSMLLLSNVQPAHIGEYDVLVFNSFGSVVSSNATLSCCRSRGFPTPTTKWAGGTRSSGK